MKKLLLLLIAIPIISFGQDEKIINQDDTTIIDGLGSFGAQQTITTIAYSAYANDIDGDLDVLFNDVWI